MDKHPKDYFNWMSPSDVTVTPSRWNLKYEQPDGWYLVQTVNEFMTYCAQMRPSEDPEAVLDELIANGAIQEAPEQFLRQLELANVIRRDQARFTKVS